MNLQEQKNIFLKTTKGKKALAYCRQLFKDFTTSKLEPLFLQYFYAQEKYFDAVPITAQSELQDYELMFWFWFYKRLDRAQREHEIYLSNMQYEKIVKELEASNPINKIGEVINEVVSNISLVPIFIGAGVFAFLFMKGRKK